MRTDQRPRPSKIDSLKRLRRRLDVSTLRRIDAELRIQHARNEHAKKKRELEVARASGRQSPVTAIIDLTTPGVVARDNQRFEVSQIRN